MNITNLKNSKGQKIIFLNVRSLYNHISELTLDFSMTNFLAICICETWLNHTMDSRLIAIPGFKVARLDRTHDCRGGGLVIYIRKDLEYEITDAELNVSNLDIESLTVTIKRNFQKDLVISLVYLPPKSNICNAINFLENIDNYISSLNLEWILGGDFNVDLSKKCNTKHKRVLQTFTSKSMLQQTIHKPTRVCSTTETIIDHIYTNSPQKCNDAGTLCYSVSDHNLVYIILKKNL